MALFSQLRAVGASAVALAVAAGAGIAFALPGSTTEVTTAVPVQAVATPDISEDQARELLITSRAAEREALATEVSDAAQQRYASLSETDQSIGRTEEALQAQRAAEAKAAAEKAAAEKAAKEKAAADKAAADKAAKDKAAAEKATATASAADAKKLGSASRAANKETARQMALSLYGWGGDQFTCYDNIIMRESVWDHTADNPTSSAYGIPQALPGSKMSSEGADWRTNPATQIKWGLKYVKERYGTPCQAWSFKRANGWY
ncbi:lytic transglycosylase domain-containing protein [Propioniciclava coleopterorum]|uniref:Lytic transglycosylase domain-containing protein n=1 Tax=Propioniciclava coleopterorum TaxID=2714937 RepID=A0A6G7Y5C2_9ACTN|nr:lytic transglycosylase domain-containing protein [Propioniciclava coleopterorum]QIK72010.1 lytic transglycosylase domain-containing protein [Propioniciclava coleopterorum]